MAPIDLGAPLFSFHEPGDPNATFVEEAQRQRHREHREHIGRGADDDGEDKDQRIPIIALTAHGGDDVEDSCFSAGMDGFINKPIETDVVKRIFNQYLSLSK